MTKSLNMFWNLIASKRRIEQLKFLIGFEMLKI